MLNRRFAFNGGLCAAASAGLIAGAVVHRRQRRSCGAPPASWRTCVIAQPLADVLVVLGLEWLGTMVAGAISD